MRNLFMLIIVAFLPYSAAFTSDLSFDKVIEKVPVAVTPNVPDQSVILQGGDNVFSATVIDSIPYVDDGTTSGYIDDYDEVCPYDGSTSPDVVYSYTPTADTVIDVNLRGSFYDTKLYVYENNVTPGFPFACNDDYYNDFSSAIFYVQLSANNTYYFVIDGYDGASGIYTMAFTASEPREPCQDVHSPNDLWSAANSDAGSSSGYLVYDEFGGAGEIAKIRAYGIMLRNGSISCTENPASFEVAFYEDSNGQPGTQMESFVVQAIQSPTGDMFGNYPLIEFRMIFPLTFYMVSGWLSVQGVSDPSDCQFYWMSGTGGDGHSYQWRGTSLFDIAYDRAWCLEIDQTSIDEVELLPTELDMLTSYPNPFNVQTTIAFSLKESGTVSVEIHDLLGRKVDRINLGHVSNTNVHTVNYNAENLSTGVYYYSLLVDGELRSSKKFSLLK